MQSVDHSVNVIEIKNVSFAYNGNEVLNNINLAIHRGDYLALVGANGAGKTTLVKIILGLLTPASGSVTLYGKAIANFKEWGEIGYVPQKVTSFDLNFPATVQEVVLMGRYGRRGLFHRITENDRDKARWALEQVEMWEFRERLIGDLSGGQQQRVFIARALATEPEIIFLDEPTAAVEKSIKEEFYALLRKLNQDLHLTVILVTHDIEGIAYDAMHIACINKTLFFHNTLEDLLKETDPAHVHEKDLRLVSHHHPHP
jgi:zinc transport system ATP-binding protein